VGLKKMVSTAKGWRTEPSAGLLRFKVWWNLHTWFLNSFRNISFLFIPLPMWPF
jgi:hypothetical protein